MEPRTFQNSSDKHFNRGINCNSSKGQKSISNHSDHLQLNNCCCRTIPHQTLSNPTQPDPTLSNPISPKDCQFPNKLEFWPKLTESLHLKINSFLWKAAQQPHWWEVNPTVSIVQQQAKQGARRSVLCRPRVLQLPLLITTTGRVNRPEQPL